MVKIRRLVKQTFQTLAGKWFTLIIFALTIIQLLSRKGARYAFNVPNRYLITQTKKYGHDKKIFLGWNKVFEKLWNSFRILSKRPREIYDRFLNKGKWHYQVIWMFSTFREYCLLPEKEMRSHCSFMHTFEEKTFLSLQMQRRVPIIWVEFKFIWYLHSILFINVTITE